MGVRSASWFCEFYCAGMTASFHVGQLMGRFPSSIVFPLIVPVLRLVLRQTGKDQPQLRRDPNSFTDR